MKTYLRILQYARPNVRYIPLFMVFTLLYSIFNAISLTAVIPTLQVLFKTVENTEVSVATLPEFTFTIAYFKQLFGYFFNKYLLDQGEFEALKFVCFILISGIILSNVFRYLSAMILARVRAYMIQRMRNEIFNKITNLQIGYFTETRRGDIISRVSTDALLIESTVVSSLKFLFKEPFQIVVYFTILFNISSSLTLYSLLVLPVGGAIISIIAKQLKKRATSIQESLGRLNNILDETLGGMRIIKAFAARLYTLRKFQAETATYSKLNISYSKRMELAGPISESLGVGVMVIILLKGGSLILSNESALAAPQFIGFLIIFSQVLNPVKALSNSFSNIQKGIAAGDRIFEIIDTNPAIQNDPDSVKVDSLKQSISLEKVSFAYEKENVLQDINIVAKQGQVIALVGPSGSGKSTLADLIPRFYDPTEGSIKIDGVDTRKIDIDSLRKLMGIVTQESILFNDTVFNNIAFGNPEASMDQVIEAAKIANAHEFISNLELGYETSIGERGSKLSGGQRQRLSIARAVLKNPDILILDEATSALDSESEMLVQEAINNLMKNRTSIVIAHRLSTIQNADEIVVMDQGKIIQRGKHEGLLEQEGMYKKLIEMQSF